MTTKTITLELDAYERLRRAKREPRESFSSVVRRLVIPNEGISGRDLLEGAVTLGFLSEEDLAAVDRLNREDRPPDIP
jgi:predicted CopG family antitoxin